MGNIDSRENISLPAPQFVGERSVEEALLERRSIRQYRDIGLKLNELSQLLWAAQGVTSPRGYRSAPSAGALYPLEIYIAAAKAGELDPGVYKYETDAHKLLRVYSGDKRISLWRAALEQSPIRNAPVVLVLCAVYERTTRKYGKRGIRYVQMEVGHAAQNICLQAVSLGLGTVVIGAFNDKEVKKILKLQADEWPLCIIPVGKTGIED